MFLIRRTIQTILCNAVDRNIIVALLQKIYSLVEQKLSVNTISVTRKYIGIKKKHNKKDRYTELSVYFCCGFREGFQILNK